MRILITTPSLSVPHGGTRVLNEWASGLSKLGHEVTLLVGKGPLVCDWYQLPVDVKLLADERPKLGGIPSTTFHALTTSDIVVIGSPHSIELARYPQHAKVFLFLQMLEHLFTDNVLFRHKCSEFYLSPHPLICISQWNADYLRQIGRTGPIHMVRNGINLEHFPITPKALAAPPDPLKGEPLPASDKSPLGDLGVILVEGWECTNPTKDRDGIARKVARRLKAEGYRIIAYSQLPLKSDADVPDEYHQRPTLAQLNELYTRATILLKATRYDARSTAPIEAMTKGTPTVRAIDWGDDDLLNLINSLRSQYNEEELYGNAHYLLNYPEGYEILSQNCIAYAKSLCWTKVIHEINELLCN